jgi:hypothetical protein
MSRLTPFILVTAFVLAGPVQLLADVTGKILGTVTDSSGAVVVGATVTLHNDLTGYDQAVKSEATGYQFLAVPIGSGYEVTVVSAGFDKAVQTGIALLVNQDFRADFKLQVGTTSQVVEARADAIQVESTSTQLGDVIQDKKMTEMPLNGRSFVDLIGLQAGVVPVVSSAAFYPGNLQPISGDQYGGEFSVNGEREAGNAFTINGGDVENNFDNGTAVIPTLDSIQEFRILSNTADAEYGRASGAQVNVVTKSGTNQIHGNAYNFLRNDDFDAKNYFNDGPKGALHQNQFGGTGGGRILRDRLFYFLDYQGTRQTIGALTNVPVPSAAMRTGDFSGASAIGFNPLSGTVHGGGATGGAVSMDQTLTNRLGYLVTNGEPYYFSAGEPLPSGSGTYAQNCTSTSQCVFPNQVIPQVAWSPAAAGTLQFIKQGNTTNSAGTPYYDDASLPQTLNDDKAGARIDWDTHTTGRWSFYYHIDNAVTAQPYGGGDMPGFPTRNPQRSQQILVGDTKAFGSSAVNELRLNYTRNVLDLGEQVSGFGKVSTWGFVEGGATGIIPQLPAMEATPGIALSSGASFANSGLGGSYDNSYQLADNFSKIVGRHTIKFGGDFRKLQLNARNITHNSGNFSFNGTETGNDFADYLLGAPNYFVQASPNDLDDRSTYGALYVQDSVKVKPNLTVNAGLRWEVGTPWADQKGRVETFIPGEESTLYPDAPEGWVFPGDPNVPPGFWPTKHTDFGPRLGVAYSPGFSDGNLGKLFGGPGKTSIRAAYGIYYTSLEQIENQWFAGNPPFAQYWADNNSYLEAPYAARNGANIGQRFPFVQAPHGTTGIWDQFLPLNSTQAAWTHNTDPYAEQWNLSIQREISRAAVLTVSYVGSQAHHLLGETQANPGSAAICLSVSQTSQVAPGSPTCGPGGENGIYQMADGTMVNGTRPYSVTSGRGLSEGLLDFGDLVWVETWHSSNYNSFQTSLQKDTGPLRFLAAYTYSKAIDDNSGFNDLWTNPFDHRLSRALAAFDLPQNLVVSYTYDLPIGKLAGSSHRALDGWQVSGITRFTSGLPVTIQSGYDSSLVGSGGGGTDFPVYLGKVVRTNLHATGGEYFDAASSFAAPTLGTFGATSRRFFFGPGTDNTDLSLHKITKITEGTSVEIRAEYFNVFNRTSFGLPSGTFTSNMGVVTSTQGDNRIGQLGAKFTF